MKKNYSFGTIAPYQSHILIALVVLPFLTLILINEWSLQLTVKPHGTAWVYPPLAFDVCLLKSVLISEIV